MTTDYQRWWNRQRKAGGTLGDAPLEEQYALQMNAIGRALDEMFNGDAEGCGAANRFRAVGVPVQ